MVAVLAHKRLRKVAKFFKTGNQRFCFLFPAEYFLMVS